MSETMPLQHSLQEVFNPRNHPSIALQAYQSLATGCPENDHMQEAFMANAVTQPDLLYPALQDTYAKGAIAELDGLLSIAAAQPDEEIKDTLWDTTSYRMAEAYWLRNAVHLNQVWRSLPETQLDRAVASMQALNEELYGRPDEAIGEAVIGEVWNITAGHELSGQAAQLKRELEEGFTVTTVTEDGRTEVTEVPALPVTEARLPAVPPELVSYLRERFYTEHPEIVTLVDDYWNNVIMPRGEETPGIEPEDLLELFRQAHALFDPENTSGIDIVLDKGARATSWETDQMAVVIGGRRVPVESKEETLSLIYHEYVIHGLHALQGLKTELPVLGTGLFTAAEEGELPDYLTFEEGLAGMCSSSVDGDKNGNRRMVSLDKYFCLFLAYKGESFRQIYEKVWRAYALDSVAQDRPLTESTIATAKKTAFNSVVRIFRGTPIDMPRANSNGKPRILTYNKDLTYVNGGLKVIEYWNRYKDDPAMLDLLFKFKADLTNKRQLALVQKYSTSN